MAGPGKTSPVGTITSPSDDQILVTLKYITPDQQKAARQQQAAEVKAGQKERAIGEILQEQTKNSTNPITKKELDLSDEVRHKVFWDRIPEAGAPKAKKPSIDESIRAAAKSLHIPEGKAVQSTGESIRISEQSPGVDGTLNFCYPKRLIDLKRPMYPLNELIARDDEF